MGTKPGRRQEFPSWVLENATFVEMLNENCESLGGESNCNSFEALSEFKYMARYCAKRVKRICNQSLATTTESKLAASIGLVRALQSSDVSKAKHLCAIYPHAASLAFRGTSVEAARLRLLHDHIVELSQEAIASRINELRQQKSTLPQHMYQQRKRWVASFFEAVAAWSIRVHSCNSGYVFGPHCL